MRRRVPRVEAAALRMYGVVLRRCFAVAERVAPGLGGVLAEWLWLRLPPRPHPSRFVLPPGGRPFELVTEVGLVRGCAWGRGPVVLLVHGWGGWAAQLRGYVPGLVERGYTVVAFDAPSHGRSGRGPTGPRASHALEFSQALAAVADRHGGLNGRLHAVVAHSVGAMATLLAVDDGRVAVDRLVFLAPMRDLGSGLDGFGQTMRFGPRTRSRLEARLVRRVGRPVAAFDLRMLSRSLDDALPVLFVHDTDDTTTSHPASAALAETWPAAGFVSTTGLGHHRLLRDPDVATTVVDFVASPVDAQAANS